MVWERVSLACQCLKDGSHELASASISLGCSRTRRNALTALAHLRAFEHTPITCAGVGIVKLMGREAGFVAMMATLASNDVDICLLPEMPFDIDKVCVCALLDLEKTNCRMGVLWGAASATLKLMR